jgi:hypothetical protein
MTIRSIFRSPLLAAAAACALAGCAWPGQRPGGAQYSVDEFTYESTLDLPQSIKLVDTSTNAVIWQFEVPIGQEVVIRFQDGYDPANVNRPSLMRWEVKERGDEWGELHNVMTVPDKSQRRVDVYRRHDTTAVPMPEQVYNPRKPPKMRDVDAAPMYSP